MAENDTNANTGTRKPGTKDMASWKPGSEAAEAKNVGGEGDFGVPEGAGSSRDREYVSHNTKMSDPGATQPFAWEHDGVRDHGAGAADSGPGSSSGGDIDTDFIGVGTGGTGVAATGPGDAPGADDTDGSRNEFAAPPPPARQGNVVIEPASGRNQTGVGKVGASDPIRGTVVQGRDVSAGADSQGADAATNPSARGDDSFAGEISSGEAQGQDLGMSPSSDTQGLGEEDRQGQKDFDNDGA